MSRQQSSALMETIVRADGVDGSGVRFVHNYRVRIDFDRYNKEPHYWPTMWVEVGMSGWRSGHWRKCSARADVVEKAMRVFNRRRRQLVRAGFNLLLDHKLDELYDQLRALLRQQEEKV